MRALWRKRVGSFFHLEKYGTSLTQEFSAGITTFLTASYILLFNPALAAETGMPPGGVYIATVLAAFFCTLGMALYANTPFVMAPGMATIFLVTGVMCAELGFHWKEALAVVFMVGVLQAALMCSSLRKTIVNAIPEYLKYASGIGVGMFIVYTGIKNAGFLTYAAQAGTFAAGSEKEVVRHISTLPSLAAALTPTHAIAFIGLFTTVVLLAMEKKTGDRYYALPLGIVAATFMGIPLQVTPIDRINLPALAGSLPIREFFEVAFSFAGDPGLLSILSAPSKMLPAGLMVLTLLFTNTVDSISSIFGTGQMKRAPVIDSEDYETFKNDEKRASRLDRTLLAASAGGSITAILGTSTSVIYIESVTGILVGGRTGLTAFFAAFFFLASLPFAGFFSIIPAAAVAPALIISGIYILSAMNSIEWDNMEESLPSATIVIMAAFARNIADAVAVGYLTHIVVQIILGNRKKIHPALYALTLCFVSLLILKSVTGI